MVDIVRSREFDEPAYRRLCAGYETEEVYRVARDGGEVAPTFSLELCRLASPLKVSWEPDPQEMATVREAASRPGSHLFWAVEAGEKIGVALAEERAWNRTLWVWGFYVDESRRRKGVGRALMQRLIDTASASTLRAIVCETQTRNVPAIRFYRAMGFVLEGIDLSHYTNEDLEKGDVALFMKRRV